MIWFINYILFTGLIFCILAWWSLSHREQILNSFPKEKEEFEEALQRFDELSLHVNPYPFLYCICMLLGWILVPYAVITEILKRF